MKRFLIQETLTPREHSGFQLFLKVIASKGAITKLIITSEPYQLPIEGTEPREARIITAVITSDTGKPYDEAELGPLFDVLPERFATRGINFQSNGEVLVLSVICHEQPRTVTFME